MKLKKFLCSVLALAMIMSTMGIVAFAESGVAVIEDAAYETIQAAVDAAQNGDTIQVIAPVTDEAVTVDKSVTIAGDVSLENVSINAVTGCEELTVNGLSFTGNSWINSGAASKLTVSGVTADVSPVNTSYTNSRSGFISLGRSEQHELELIVEKCAIVTAGDRTNPIIGWAAVKNVVLSGNTFATEENKQWNSDSIKFMAIAKDAEFTITNNTVYSDYNGIVFGQNTTRDNAYTVTLTGNKFVGGADHIWIEVSGSKTTHGKFVASSDNTINGNAFTADDFKMHPNITTCTGYAGVDVAYDANGKIASGTFTKISNVEAYLADGATFDATTGEVIGGAFVAKCGNICYDDLQKAVDAAKAGDTIKVLNDVTAEVNPTADSTSNDYNCLIHTDKDDDITLDLNGKTISVKGSDEAKYDTLAIRNNGTLHIVDNSANKNGKITLSFDGTQEVGSSQIHSTILNFGTLTVTDVDIENTAKTGYSTNAIYNYSWGGNAILTVNSGKISSYKGWGIQQAIYDDFSKYNNYVTVNGGEIFGGVYCWYQGACADCKLEINGGTLNAGKDTEALRIRTSGDFALPVVVSDDVIIKGATRIQAAAYVGGKYYASLTKAVEAAKDGDVVYVQPGTYEGKIVVNKSIVLTGDPAYGSNLSLMAVTEKPVIKIKDVTNGGVEFYAPNVVFDSLVFDIAADATGSTWNVSALGYYYENTKNKDGLTVTNCDFINNSDMSMSAVAANIGAYTIQGNSFTNFETMVHSYVDHGAVDTVTVSNNTFTNVKNIINAYYGAPANGSATIVVADNQSTDGSVAKVDIDDFGQTKATPASAYKNVTVTGNDAQFVMHNYGESEFVLTASGNEGEIVYNYRNEELLNRLAGDAPEGTVYVDYGRDTQQVYTVNADGTIVTAEKVELVFEKVEEAGALDNSVWNLVLTCADDELINRLNSADFTFALTAEDNMDYEIVEINPEIEINNVNNLKDRYEFHFKNKDKVADTDTAIVIGQVRFTGYGEFSFIVKDATTNAVHATTLKDNIVASYTVNGLIVNNAKENTDGDNYYGTIGSEIVAPTSDLIINIDFPNAVENKIMDYQKMTVTVTGEDINDIVIDLGSDMETVVEMTQPNKATEYYTVLFDGGYRIEIKNALTQNTAYDIKVEGAGYRTARYTVNMQETDSKTINFWNNVKDADADVEAGKFQAKKNFLAGDIVKDNNINVYDLSAVVSYFGETGLVGNNNAYAKYDLNRDGVIDSKDVAMVLVSWGN